MRPNLFWLRGFIVLAVALSGAFAAQGINGDLVVGANWRAYPGYSRQLVIVDSSGNFVAGRDIFLSGYDVMRLTAVATDPDTGTLFAGVVLWDRETSELVTIDPMTGIATPVGDTGHVISALSFAPDGTLYAVSGNRDASPRTLYTINKSTGTATFACSLENGTFSQAIGFDAAGLLYHASGTSSAPAVFESFDLSSSCMPTPIGLTGDPTNIVMGMLFTGTEFLMTDQYKLFDLSTTGVVSHARTYGFPGEEGNDGARGLAFVPAGIPLRDLATTLTFNPNPVSPLTTTVATITVSNPGSDAATGVNTVARYAEPFLGFTTHSGDASCSHLFSGYISCDFGEIAAGASETVDLSFNTLITSGSAPMEATAVGNEWDTDPYDNIANAVLTLAQADFGVAMDAGKSPAQKGKPLTYNITVTNAGPGSATNVYLSDIVPAGLTYQSASGATCALAAGIQVVCALGNLASGASMPISLTFLVNLPGKSTISNTVLLTSVSPDSNTANNSATVVKKVVGKP